MSHEKNPAGYFPCNTGCLMTGFLFHGFMKSPHNWVVFPSPIYPQQPFATFFHCSNKKSHYIRVRGRCESGNTNQTWGHHFPLGDSATPSWTYYSNSIIYAGRGLRIIFATTHPVFHQKFFFLRGSSDKNQWYIIDTISRNRCFDQLGSACMMLGKGFKHILPYGGETWWFTMVQSLKKSPQKTNPSISSLPLDSFNTAASLDGNHVSLQLSIRLNKNSPTKQRDPYFMVYYNPHITG